MNIKEVIYGSNRFGLSGKLSIDEIKASMIEIYPELKGATAIQKGSQLYFVPREKMLQNQLDIELAQKKEANKMSIDLKPVRIPPPSIHYSAYEGGRNPAQLRLYGNGKWHVVKTPLVVIKGEYAARGGYEHLVGKYCDIIQENKDLEVYLVQAKGDNKQYVIRKKDIEFIQ